VSAIAFIGYGSLASELAKGIASADDVELRAYSRPPADPGSATVMRRRMEAAGVQSRESIETAVAGADIVIAAVPAAAAAEVAAACSHALGDGTLYIDPSPLPPAAKERLSAELAVAGAAYVDVAVLGTVATDGARVPMLAAGPGAERWAEAGRSFGLQISVVDGPPGRASTVKLLRSVFMKGRDALILEMLLAARQYGLERAILDSMPPGEPFEALAERVVCSLALYAERRADELAASAQLVSEAGVEPLATLGGYQRLRRLADLRLRDHYGTAPPDHLEAVLALVEQLGAPGSTGPL
jgi:3-hydroxyisobutyrate dehydrogenase-like beta-hydroxyacid dehydrogenase